MNIQDINFKPLFQWINTCLGTQATFAINLDSKRPKIVTVTNLFNHSGIFQSVINNVTVDFFNFNYTDEGNIWATVNLSYESWSGGSNGMQIGTCWFNPETGWTFESSKERFKKYNDQ